MLLHKSQANFPDEIRNAPKRTFNPKYTLHAKEAADDRNIVLPNVISFSGKDVFEAQIEDGKIVKVCIRIGYNAKNDLILAVLNDRTVKTVWTNRKGDDHKTLDLSKYTR
jgi:hypothetical protein